MEYENVGIGKEQPKVEAKPVVVTGISEEVVTFDKKEGKETSVKLVLRVSHPDIPEMEIGKVKFEKNKKLKDSGLWLTKDKDGYIPFNSAVATLLRFYGCTKVSELVEKTLQTTIDDNGYLEAKAY